MSEPSLPDVALPQVTIRFDNTLGVLNIGNTLNAILYGVATVQVYTYYHRYSTRDHVFLKSLIFVMWILNTLGMGLYLETTYYYNVTNFLNPDALTSPPWSILADWLIGLIGDCAVTGVYAFRVWKLSNSLRWIAVGVITTMTLLSLATGISFFGVALGHNYSEFGTRFPYLWYTTFGSQLVADLIITTSLCKTLYKRRTGIRRTDSLLNVLMLYTINTCAFTSVMRAGSILAYAFGQGTFIFVTVSSLLPRLIFSSLLALLNSRRAKQEQMTDGLVSIQLSNLRSENSQQTVTVGEGVKVETHTEQTFDLPTVKHEDIV